MTVARALRAGPGAARALREGGAGRVEIVLRGGGYVSLGRDGWVLLAGPRAQHGPLSLHVVGLEPLVAGATARVVDGRLEVGDQRIALAGMRVPGSRLSPPQRRAFPVLSPEPATQPQPPERRIRPPLPELRFPPPELSLHPPPPELRAGVTALSRGELGPALRLLCGRGDGLTPAGDDVLAGYAGWEAAAGVRVRVAEAAVGRTTPLGVAYLRCAERGELPEAAEILIAALRADDARAAGRGARMLARWGATSGQAMMLGIAAAAERASGQR
jgi:Protein of unknown function (DUF2877)